MTDVGGTGASLLQLRHEIYTLTARELLLMLSTCKERPGRAERKTIPSDTSSYVSH
jgi:hypothetical protein